MLSMVTEYISLDNCRRISTDKFFNDLLNCIPLFSHAKLTVWPAGCPFSLQLPKNQCLKCHSIHKIIKTRTKFLYSIATMCIQSVFFLASPYNSSGLKLYPQFFSDRHFRAIPRFVSFFG